MELSRFRVKPSLKGSKTVRMSGVMRHAFTSSRGVIVTVMPGPSRGFVAIAMEQRYDASGT
jgi:hypothetical protein